MSDRRNQPTLSALYPDWEPSRDEWRAQQEAIRDRRRRNRIILVLVILFADTFCALAGYALGWLLSNGLNGFLGAVAAALNMVGR